MAKTASLTSGLVAKKGQASPAITHEEAPSAPVTKIPSTDYYKALTVKLDRKRYESLKTVGLKLDKRSQEIFVEALDHYLEQLAQHGYQ